MYTVVFIGKLVYLGQDHNFETTPRQFVQNTIERDGNIMSHDYLLYQSRLYTAASLKL